MSSTPCTQIAAEAATERVLAEVWKRNLPVLHERLAVLDRAASEPSNEPLRAEALSVGHRLAGTLGMFGYHEGTHLARAIEAELESTANPEKLRKLIASLRLSTGL